MATSEPQTDPGHLLPADVWAKVVADAERHAHRRSLRASAAGSIVTKTIPAYSYGGVMPHPTLIVIHDAETPLQAGYATSLATNWFGTSRAGTSAHYIVDPVDVVKMLDEDVVAWHVGPAANGFTIGVEQSGYVTLSRAQWTTADGMTQLGKVGALVADIAPRHGIPLRWATDDQIRAAAHGIPGGICHHDDIRRVLGGTTHTDPAPHYPSDLLAQAWGTPTPEGFLMALSDSEQREILDLARYMGKNHEGDLFVHEIPQRVASLVASSDADAIAAAVVKALPSSNGGLTAAQMKQAVKDGIAELVAAGSGS